MSFWIIRGFIFPEPSPVHLFDKVIMGVLGAVPVWFVLWRRYTNAYLWILANVIGYAFIGVFPVVWSFVLNISLIKNVSGYSFFTYRLIPNSLWVIAYSLFGLVLGASLDRMIKDSVVGLEQPVIGVT